MEINQLEHKKVSGWVNEKKPSTKQMLHSLSRRAVLWHFASAWYWKRSWIIMKANYVEVNVFFRADLCGEEWKVPEMLYLTVKRGKFKSLPVVLACCCWQSDVAPRVNVERLLWTRTVCSVPEWMAMELATSSSLMLLPGCRGLPPL